ncbi:hypothetical protein HH303_19880, partial [Rhodospirillaceae bacterium KN72]
AGQDENVLENLEFTVTLTDGEGTEVSGAFTVDVIDDVPVLTTGEAPSLATGVTVDEDDVAGGTDEGTDSTSATGDLGLAGKDLYTVNVGADDDNATGQTSLTYDDFDYTITPPSQELKSGGETITYNQSGNVLTASADGETVFTVTLNGDGSYTFDLVGSIDHADGQDENSIALDFGLSGTVKDGVEILDGDGDAVDLSGATVSQTFTVTVVDDVPEASVNQGAVGTADGVSVDEDDLVGGTDEGNDSLSATGNLGLGSGDLITIDYGADGPSDENAPTGLTAADLDYSFDISALPTDLTSEGDAITFTQTNGVLTATADAGGTNERPVFTVSIDPATGSYTFTLQDNLDHETANGQNVEGLTFSVIGTPSAEALAEKDFDQDAIDGLDTAQITQNFSVDVTDDVPVAVNDTTVFATEGGSAVAGNVMLNDTVGADDAGAELTSFTYTDENGATQTGMPGVPVDTQYGALTVNSDGSWIYTPDEESDHTATGGQSLFDGFTYTITDGDGDTATAEQPIKVRDDKPTITVNPPPPGDPNLGADGAFVDEDDLTAAQGDTEVGTDGTGSSAVSGTLTIDGGQDGVGGVTLSVPQALTDMGLESNGVPLTYTVSPDGQTITGSAGADEIFTMTLTGDAQNGYGWAFDLKDAIDHPTATAEDVISNIPFTVTVTDNDGSTASATIEIDVVDDVPTAVDDGDVRLEGAGDTTGSASTGNLLLDNDTLGADADGSEITGISYTNESGQTVTAAVDPTNGVTVDTQYGSLTVNADGSWSYTADDQIDHVNDQDVTDSFTYTMQDGDGDESTAAFSVSIGDEGPEISFPSDGGPQATGSGSVDEDDLKTASGDAVDGSDGSDASQVTKAISVDFGEDGPADTNPLALEIPQALTDMGLKSGTVPLTYTLSPDGQTITGSAGADTIFTMSLGGDAQNGFTYTFDLVGNLDHEEGLGENLIEDIPFTVVATDGDGTEQRGTIEIDVRDDVPDAVDDGEYRLNQAGDSTGNTVTGNLLTDNDTAGADGAEITSFSYTDENGATQTGTPGVEVDTQYGTLTVNSDGSWTYTADSDVVNVNGQDVEDDFTYTLTDGDGDSDTATVHLVIGDDGPEIYFPSDEGPQQTGSGLVDEDDLSTGAGDAVNGTDGTGSSDVTRPVTIDFGVDGPAATDPAILEIPQELIDMGLESNGVPLTYTLSPDNMTITGSAGTDTVFTMTLDGNPTDGFTYTFDLVGNLDHDPVQGENLIEDIPFTIVATDADGTETRGSIEIDVRDDVPELTQTAGPADADTVTVDEDDTADGTDGSQSASATGALGLSAISFGVDAGADGAQASGGVDLDPSNLTITGPTGLTSNGAEVTYNQVGNVLTASANGETVFTVTLNGDDTFTFEMVGNLDHPAGADENTMTLDFGLSGTVGTTFTATDGDGDTVSAGDVTIDHGFSVNVVDDVPEAIVNQDAVGTATTGSVDEDDLADGSSPDAGALTTGGSLGLDDPALIGIDYGADGPAAGAPAGL